MNVALINPPPAREYERHWAGAPALGLAYIASSLREHGHKVTVLDGKLTGLSIPQIVEEAQACSAGLVGITCMTVEFPQARRVAQQIRCATSAEIILGGAHVNAVGALALEECPDANFACAGEGEHLVRELVDALSAPSGLGHIAGLIHRTEGRIVQNRPRAYHDRYDELPFPAWDLFAVGRQIPIITHRGCPFECNFCGHNSGFMPRYRSPENVLSEMEYVVARFAPEIIRIEDETFGLDMSRTKSILRGILARRLNLRVRFSAQTRVDRVDVEFIRLLKACGFETLELGVESGNTEVLRRMGKRICREQVEQAVLLAKEAGLSVWCKFILGHPHETAQQMRDTAAFIAHLNPERLSVSLMTPFPGTPIYDMAVRGEGGYRLVTRDWGDFDKYAVGALELESMGLARMKVYQLWCYLNLYLANRRLGELARLVAHNRGLALEMGVQLARAVARDAVRRRPSPGVQAHMGRIGLSDVAMSDPTLHQLRHHSGHKLKEQVGVGRNSGTLRTWRSPEGC